MVEKNSNNVISLSKEALKRGIKRHHTIELLKEQHDIIDANLLDNKIMPTRDEEEELEELPHYLKSDWTEEYYTDLPPFED